MTPRGNDANLLSGESLTANMPCGQID